MEHENIHDVAIYNIGTINSVSLCYHHEIKVLNLCQRLIGKLTFFFSIGFMSQRSELPLSKTNE